MKRNKIKILAAILTLSSALAVGLTGCGSNAPDSGNENSTYTYRIYTPVSPSNWNLLTQQDDNDKQISNLITSQFFDFDFAYDENGEIIDGGFTVHYSAATNLEDVTAEYAGQYGIAEDTTSNRAWRITLRDDLKWNDGTAITANDFVYSMEQALDPMFMNRLAAQYYSANMILHNARNYVYAGESMWDAADGPYVDYTTDLDSKIIFTLGNPSENAEYGGAVSSMRDAVEATENDTAADIASLIVANGAATTVDAIVQLQGKTLAEIKADESLRATWEAVIGWWQTDPNEELDFFVTYYTYPDITFDEVGYFAESERELVVIYDNTFEFIDANGELTYEAPYYLQDFPLVKRDLYEASKRAPVTGSSLWTSNYNSSVATTASWGPYMLTNFQAGTTYTLSRNENWYGYNMDEYEGQYQTDRIVCRTITEWNTAWLAFQNGELDDISIDPTIAAQYRTSQRAYFTPNDMVASVHIQSSRKALEARQSSGVNKTILMQPEFRQALSLAIDRDRKSTRLNSSHM